MVTELRTILGRVVRIRFFTLTVTWNSGRIETIQANMCGLPLKMLMTSDPHDHVIFIERNHPGSWVRRKGRD